MQRGIGRAGYILLAFAALSFGLFGLALSWVAFGAGQSMFYQMGVAVIGVALLALFLFAASGTRGAATQRAPRRTTPDTPAPPRREAARQDGVDFEFKDYEPAPRAAPTELVVPPAFAETRPPAPETMAPVEFQVRGASMMAARGPAREMPMGDGPARDPAAWPEQRGRSAWTAQQDHRRKVQAEIDDSRRRQELADRYTSQAPTMRNILSKAPAPPGVPEKIAERAPRDMNTDFVAPGMSVGRCGQCATLLLAPEVRPLRLKCPECAKVTLLE